MMTKKAATIYSVITLISTVMAHHSVLISKNVSSWGPDTPSDKNAVAMDTKGKVPISQLLLVLQPEPAQSSTSPAHEEEKSSFNSGNFTSSANTTANTQEGLKNSTTESKTRSTRELPSKYENLIRMHRTYSDAGTSDVELYRFKRQGYGGGGYGGGGFGGGGGGGFGGGGGGGSGLYPILDQSLSMLGYMAFFSLIVVALLSLLGGRMGMMGTDRKSSDEPMLTTPRPEMMDDSDANCLQWIRCYNKQVPWKMGTAETEKMIYEVPMSMIPEAYRKCPVTLKPCTSTTYMKMVTYVSKMRDKWKIL